MNASAPLNQFSATSLAVRAMNCTGFIGSEELRVYGSVFGILIAAVTVAGNALVLLAVYRTPSLHNMTNYFLASLAVADCYVGITALPMFVVFLFVDYDTMRFITAALYMQSLAASMYSLCAVTIDRYIAVRWPLRYHSLVTFWRMLCFVWVFSVLAAVMPYTFGGYVSWFVSVLLVFLLPIALITYCYAFMLREAYRQKKDESQRTAGEMAARAENRKAAVTVAIVVGVFLLFTTPVIVAGIGNAIGNSLGLCGHDNPFEKGSRWVSLVSYSNSAINPFIYAARKTEFREAFKKIFRRNIVVTNG